MADPLIVRGQYVDHTFIPDGQLPDAEGTAELIITPQSGSKLSTSVFDLFGKAHRLRSADEIAVQFREERDDWGES